MAAKPKPVLEFHPSASGLPLLAGKERTALLEHIRDFGLIHPVVLLDGQVFDGRNRYLICLELGIEPKFVELSESVEASQYDYGANVLRRHLTTGQVAQYVAERLNGKAEERKGGAPPQNNATAQDCAVNSAAGLAKETGVPSRSVQVAAEIKEKGAPELVQAVKDGVVKQADAKAVLKKSPDVQKRAVAKVRSGQAKTAKEAVKGKKGKPIPTAYTPFKEIDGACGKILAAIDRLADKHPAKFYKQAIEAQKHVMQIVKDWWIAVK